MLYHSGCCIHPDSAHNHKNEQYSGVLYMYPAIEVERSRRCTLYVFDVYLLILWWIFLMMVILYFVFILLSSIILRTPIPLTVSAIDRLSIAFVEVSLKFAIFIVRNPRRSAEHPFQIIIN